MLTFFAFARRDAPPVSRPRGRWHGVILAQRTLDRQVRIEFDDERVRLENGVCPRRRGLVVELDEIVVFDSFWASQLSNGGCIVVPRSLLSPELEGFLRAKARSVMANIREK